MIEKNPQPYYLILNELFTPLLLFLRKQTPRIFFAKLMRLGKQMFFCINLIISC